MPTTVQLTVTIPDWQGTPRSPSPDLLGPIIRDIGYQIQAGHGNGTHTLDDLFWDLAINPTTWKDVDDPGSDVTYRPWTDGHAVGFRCEHQRDGAEPLVEFIYLNPSDSEPDDVPNVFLYQGVEGNPAGDGCVVHFIIDEATTSA